MDILFLVGGLLLILLGANGLTDGAASVAKRFHIPVSYTHLIEIMSPHYRATRDGSETTIPKDDLRETKEWRMFMFYVPFAEILLAR